MPTYPTFDSNNTSASSRSSNVNCDDCECCPNSCSKTNSALKFIDSYFFKKPGRELQACGEPKDDNCCVRGLKYTAAFLCFLPVATLQCLGLACVIPCTCVGCTADTGTAIYNNCCNDSKSDDENIPLTYTKPPQNTEVDTLQNVQINMPAPHH